MGKSQKKAEQAFLENVINPEEREAFSREIEEADVWVDHSDISDQE